MVCIKAKKLFQMNKPITPLSLLPSTTTASPSPVPPTLAGPQLVMAKDIHRILTTT